MFQFKDKTVLILVNEGWGNMKISKHHYAINLGRLGANVFFLDPALDNNKISATKVEIKETEYPNVKVVYHSVWFPWLLKFKAPAIFKFLMKKHLATILKQTGKIDVLLNYDLNRHYYFDWFPKSTFKIFFPVDEPKPHQLDTGAGSDCIISITAEILEKYKNFQLHSLLINHSIDDIFVNTKIANSSSVAKKVGYSGNLLRSDIDRDLVILLVETYPHLQFHFWGTYNSVNNNLGSIDIVAKNFIAKLENMQNVILHGVVNSTALAKAYNEMDIFINCYDIQKDASKGTNYHKIMEYLSTGKVIVSNNFTAYKNFDEHFIVMCKRREDNREFLPLFNEVVTNIETYNSYQLQKERMDFANSNTYTSNIQKIENFIRQNFISN